MQPFLPHHYPVCRQRRRLSRPACSAIVIVGPTASGKSMLAVLLAQMVDGIIINADSMQLYREIPALTDAPQKERLRVPHRLYGCLNADTPCSVGLWQQLAQHEIHQAHKNKKVPIIVGGTGLYIRSLLEGLTPLPTISPDIRQKARDMAATTPPESLHRRLQAVDPHTAHMIHPKDRQRLTRAWEVFLSSGKPLSWWLARETRRPHKPTTTMLIIALEPPRQHIYRRCDQRVKRMMARGALDEVRRLDDKNLSRQLPAMKAIGVQPLLAVLRRECSLPQAISAIQQSTRHYAKRQYTWQKTQGPRAHIVLRHIPSHANLAQLALGLASRAYAGAAKNSKQLLAKFATLSWQTRGLL